MPVPSRSPRSERGQTAAEYLGLLLLVVAIVGILATTPIGGTLRDGIGDAICRVTGGDCRDDGGTERRADGRPPLSQCVTDSAKRGINGSIKAFFVKLGGGVEALREERADGSVKITIKGNAKAGLEFTPGGATVNAGGDEVGTGKREFEVSANGEAAKAWVFKDPKDADRFVEDVTKKVKAIADPRWNFPGTDDDADIELPPSSETTVAGGVSVRGKGELKSGTGVEGNLGASVGATFDDVTGDKTIYFEAVGGASAKAKGQAGGSPFDLGGGGEGKTRFAVTYDKDGKEKSLQVLGQADVSRDVDLKKVTDGADLRKVLASAKELTRSGGAQGGGRLIVDARLDLTRPENLAALRTFIDGRDPVTKRPVSRMDGAGALLDRFVEDGSVNARGYLVAKGKTGAKVDLGPFGVSGEFTTEDAQLIDAYYRDLENGDFQRWEDCVRGLAA